MMPIGCIFTTNIAKQSYTQYKKINFNGIQNFTFFNLLLKQMRSAPKLEII